MANMNGSIDKVLTLDNMNPHIKVMEYAVRGPLVIRAVEIEKELLRGVKKPFSNVIRANIGDAHAMGQAPITFLRQVLALISFPELITTSQFPADVKTKANLILDGCKGRSAGSYSDSTGIEIIRKHAAEFIERRDGLPSHPDHIILTAGASEGIRSILKMLRDRCEKIPGVMIPIPQYPLYSASLAEYDIYQVGYYLNEAKNWGLDITELERSITEARNRSINPRAIVVINPGNPTGQVLTRKNIEEIIRFAYKEKLFLLADEVYQDNIYDENSEFHSFKKVLIEMGHPYDKMELASFFSTSKGYMGECGLRGGYAEVINMDPGVKGMLLKSISAKLCPTVLGQAAMDCVVDHPKPGDPSYERWIAEKTFVLKSLAKRAKMVADIFNSIPNVQCNPVMGAMYAFPSITLPPKAIAAAKEKGLEPDAFYAFELLESTGVCIIPGSGFGQKPGTWHFRTTILPQPQLLAEMLERFKGFHLKFIEKYGKSNL